MVIHNLYQDYLQGKAGLEYTVDEIDRAIGGITAIFYTPQKLTIQNHLQRISLKWQDKKRRTIKNAQKFALLTYQKAQQNGSKFPGELHFGENASTKDHTLGIKRMFNYQGSIKRS